MKYQKLKQIISGGQTGADMGGLKYAYLKGIKTGGVAPRDFRTEVGNTPKLLRDTFGLVETKSKAQSDYRERTIENIKLADGTVIFAERTSPGSTLTKNVCVKLRKPYIINPTPENFILWLNRYKIEILNVAGNRESVSKGIESKVIRFLELTIGDCDVTN